MKKPRTLRLSNETIKTLSGTFTYFIIPNRNSGRKNVFTVLVKCSGDPVTIGRELTLDGVRSLIIDFEKVPQNFTYFGDRTTVIQRLNKIAVGWP